MKNQTVIHLTIAAITAGVFLLDWIAPLGRVVWVLYLLPICGVYRSAVRWAPIYLAALCSVLVVVGYFLSPPGIAPEVAAINRSLGVLIFWIAGISRVVQKGRFEDSRSLEVALRQSEERTRRFLDNANVGLTRLNRDLIYLSANPAYAEIAGMPLDKIIGRPMAEVLGAAGVETIRPYVERVLRGEHVTYEAQVPFVGVGPRYLQISYSPDVDAAGDVVGWVSCVTDITERKLAEVELRESEARLRAFLSNSMVIGWLKDEHGRHVYLSENFEKHFGVRLADWKDKTDFELWPPDIAEEFRRNDQAVLDSGKPIEVIEHTTNRDGSKSWWLNHKFIVRDGNGKRFVGGLGVDITARKEFEDALLEREERLRAILSAAPDAIVTFSEQRTILSVNEAAEHLFGYSADEMVGQNVSMLIPSSDGREHDEYIVRFLKAGESNILGRETLGKHKQGGVLPIELSVREVGHLKMFTGIIHDLTRRKELEHEVVEIASLEQRRIGQDLHDTVSQELTALGIQIADLQETLSAATGPEKKLLQQLKAGLQRCQQDLRAVVRGLMPVSINSEGLVAALAELAERTQDSGKANCVFECQDRVSFADDVTAPHLYLIAREAVHNAIKHAAPQTIRIRLNADSALRLTVEDDGAGMANELNDAEASGGLGLRIMRNRAAFIGAVLSITPNQPKGTRVECALRRYDHVPSQN